MGYEYIRVAKDDHLTIVTLNRPEVLNALHGPAHWELHKVFDEFEKDDQQWVAIVTGAGDRAFCAGNDLKYHAAKGQPDQPPPSGFAGLSSRFGMTKPVIAAVNGLAMGGGFETALACDLIIASENAGFALPEPRVGLIALAGGLLRLPRAIGMKRAMGLALTARKVSAKEGLEYGFVNEVVPEGQVLEAAKKWAEDICKLSPLAVRAAKQVMQQGTDMPLDRAMSLQWGCPAVRTARASSDAIEGPRAFAEKRQPVWQGK